MLYLIALLPPLAVFMAGKPFQALLINLPLTLLVYFPGLIHALFVVHNYYADKRTGRVVDAIRKSGA